MFDALWSQVTHPQDYPGNPHFSPLIGATHSAAVRFWADGAIASDGRNGAVVPMGRFVITLL